MSTDPAVVRAAEARPDLVAFAAGSWHRPDAKGSTRT
jgi:hypothetical protein